ncbi:hypothetical protein Godav_005986 [Gossypium davidsonii]|uniref:Phytosulfokine-beta n=3 Tax=Gossypium TaxID=3633 RepID=A0A7J8S2G1_GOSDV|nr:hypothetical protein [Gossypium davidsonii]
MASSSLLSKLLLLLFISYIVLWRSKVDAQVEETSLKLMRDALEWPLSVSLYSDLNDNEGEEEVDGEEETGHSRRSLFWTRMRHMDQSTLTLEDAPGLPAAGDEQCNYEPMMCDLVKILLRLWLW